MEWQVDVTDDEDCVAVWQALDGESTVLNALVEGLKDMLPVAVVLSPRLAGTVRATGLCRGVGGRECRPAMTGYFVGLYPTAFSARLGVTAEVVVALVAFLGGELFGASGTFSQSLPPQQVVQFALDVIQLL